MKLKIKKSFLVLTTLLLPIMLIGGPVLVVGTPTTVFAATCEGGDARACLADAKVSPIMNKLKEIITFLSALVMVIAIIMLIVGGIQYTTSNGNPQAVAAAKKKITDVLIGVIAYVFLWSFLQWIIPGGIWS